MCNVLNLVSLYQLYRQTLEPNIILNLTPSLRIARNSWLQVATTTPQDAANTYLRIWGLCAYSVHVNSRGRKKIRFAVEMVSRECALWSIIVLHMYVHIDARHNSCAIYRGHDPPTARLMIRESNQLTNKVIGRRY